jgi:hypothetical protein
MRESMMAMLTKGVQEKIGSVYKVERSEVFKKQKLLEKEIYRKSMLIFGTPDMSEKLESANLQKI